MRSEERGVPTHRADMSSHPPPRLPLKDGNLHTADHGAPLCPPFTQNTLPLICTYKHSQSYKANTHTHKYIFGTSICSCLMHELGFMTRDPVAGIALHKHMQMHILLHM